MPTNHEAETKRVEVMTRFARIIDGRDRSTETERQEAFQAAQAEGISTFDSIRAHILLGVASDNNELANKWLEEVEFGDFDDNSEVFVVSQRCVEGGQVEQGLAGMCLLRAHIVRSGEIKSVRHLLPEIDKVLVNAGVAQLTPEADFAKRPESKFLEGDNSFPLFM